MSNVTLTVVNETAARVTVVNGAAPVRVMGVGSPGPQGPPGQWLGLTQDEFDAIPVKDPFTLYVILPG